MVKMVIHLEYDLGSNKELAKLVDAMHRFSKEELRLWIIQEMANFGHECWQVVEIGTQVLKEKIGMPKSKFRDKKP